MRQVLALALLGSLAFAPPAGAELTAFDGFVRRTVPMCLGDASTRCYAAAFRFADQDGDGKLSLEEATRFRTLLGEWTDTHWERLDSLDRGALTLGFWVVDLAGLEALFRSYDQDGDGFLSPGELQADIRLDHRPLPEVLQDTGAIDWSVLSTRLGRAARLLQGFRPAGTR